MTFENDDNQWHDNVTHLTTNDRRILQRLTSVAYPDGTTISNRYTRLDLTATKDRLGAWTYFGFDAVRRNIAVTNALGNYTLYNYCTCGA
jgi:hypothetical protein